MATPTMMPVLYNACFGGFSIPDEVERELADGPLFTTLFPPVPSSIVERLEVAALHPWGHGFQQVEGRYSEKGRHRMLNIIKNGEDRYFYTGDDAYRRDWKAWRSAPEVVGACRRTGVIGVRRGGTLLEIKYIPVGSQFAFESRDGREVVRVIPPYVDVIEDLLGILKGGARDADYLHPLTVQLLAGEITALSLSSGGGEVGYE